MKSGIPADCCGWSQNALILPLGFFLGPWNWASYLTLHTFQHPWIKIKWMWKNWRNKARFMPGKVFNRVLNGWWLPASLIPCVIPLIVRTDELLIFSEVQMELWKTTNIKVTHFPYLVVIWEMETFKNNPSQPTDVCVRISELKTRFFWFLN